MVLLHYLGDKSIAVDYPHGNSKNSIHNYQRTCPSVLQQLRSAPDLPGNGTKRIPSSEPLYQKIHFSIVLESGRNLNFKRHAYLPIHFEKNKLVLLHYLGDKSIAVDYPHGNSKNSIHNYQRTCPSVLQQLRSAPDLPGNFYKKFISENAISTVPPSLLPRNTRQVINLQHNEHQQSRLSHDALYNLHELSLDLSGFVKVIRTHPDLIVVCGLDIF